LGRPRHTWEDNTKMNLKEVGWGMGMYWIYLAQDRDRWQALKPSGPIKCGEFD